MFSKQREYYTNKFSEFFKEIKVKFPVSQKEFFLILDKLVLKNTL